MRRKTPPLLLLSLLALALAVTPVWAELEGIEQSTKTKGATTITWDSSFADFDYTLGEAIILHVDWTVDAGAALFSGVELKRFTPRSKKDPAEGTMDSVTLIDDSDDDDNDDGIYEGTVEIELTFTALHLDKRRNVEIGNAHLKLYLAIDTDGDGEVDSVAGYGVNVHVEDPQD
ncbi:MAG: hypothetical protein D6736_00015 [Nitrospinota bacterium]|nr:MAG: hypothetical protein D6736_00015 [Nitrospinota bacterium]